MDCAVCPITVRKALEKVSGVSSAKVDFASKRAQVVFDPKKASVDALTDAAAEAIHPTLSGRSDERGRVEFHHHVSGVWAQERRDDALRRLRVALRMRALQDGAEAELRRLLRVLLVRHQQVPADAAVRLMLR
jgi:copper chaperone CopZ